MKLEDMIMVVENQKGTETNCLMNLTDYMGGGIAVVGQICRGHGRRGKHTV